MTERRHMDNAFMARAIQLSIDNVRAGSGGPFGAVIVKEGLVIAEAANQVTATNDPTAHAEVLAIRQACQRFRCFELRGCDLYSSCEPCPMCLGAIYWAVPHNPGMPTIPFPSRRRWSRASWIASTCSRWTWQVGPWVDGSPCRSPC